MGQVPSCTNGALLTFSPGFPSGSCSGLLALRTCVAGHSLFRQGRGGETVGGPGDQPSRELWGALL